MRSLQEQHVVPVEDTTGRRPQLVYAPTEYSTLIPYAYSPMRLALYVLLVLGSGSLLGIASVWFPQLFTWIARRRLPYSSVGQADCMLILVHADGFRSKWVEVPVHRPSTSATSATMARVSLTVDDRGKQPWVWFEFKKHRYVFNQDKGEFERYLATVSEDLDRVRLRLDTGLDASAAMAKVALFGDNRVDIAPPFIPMLLFTKLVHPYYVFQLFSATVWFLQEYTLYAIVILALSAISMTWEIYSEVSNSNRLRTLMRSNHKVRVFRAGASSGAKMITLHETDLVPGDIVELSPGPVVADVLLLSGGGCVVDEAALTGEAVPVNKEPARGSGLLTEATARAQYRSSFLHAGSSITRIREASAGGAHATASTTTKTTATTTATAPAMSAEACRGVVLSTGFSTGKGELFRSILFPREITFEFERDSYRYLLVLAIIAISAFIKRLVDFGAEGYGFGYTLAESLDLITIAVPPALPLVLSSGVGFALNRLQKGGIFCIDSKRINSCGQLSAFCFDKTGTLTQESLDFVGVDIVKEATTSPTERMLERVGLTEIPESMRIAMGTCNSISDVDGELQGYSLELSMFAAAQLTVQYTHGDKKARYLAIATMPPCSTKAEDQDQDQGEARRFGVLKRFPFDPACQRSSVVVEDMTTMERFIFVKGSPEAIREIATDTPMDFQHKAMRYAAEGHYCIGFGMRTVAAGASLNLDARHEIERQVSFMGISLFHNELKPESRGMLQELYEASIDVRVITGDHALTAVHVGRLLDMKLKSKVAIVDVAEASSSDGTPFTSSTTYQCMDQLRMATGANEVPCEPFNAANLHEVLREYDVALTGAALEHLRTTLSEDSMQHLLMHTPIFARIRPQQKAWIVERLMDAGLVVGMVGDGTNDCGALKAAHVGLALSSAEASIVAPFTSKAKAVTDVPVLIREGRCALTTSFLGFKFMVLYPIIQLGMASTLGHFNTMLSNNQYLWDDLAIVLGLAIVMLCTGSSKVLSKERPPNTLFSTTIVLSILGQILLFIGFFAGVVALLNAQSWFCPRSTGMDMVTAFMEDPTSVPSAVNNDSTLLKNCAFYLDHVEDVDEAVDDIEYSHEDTVIWLFAHLQYYSVAAAFNIKDPFRLPFYTNYLYTGMFTVMLAINLWFLMDNGNSIGDTFQTLPLTSSFRWQLLLLFVGHIVASLLWEMVATWVVPRWRLARQEKSSTPEVLAVGPVENETAYTELATPKTNGANAHDFS